MSYKTEQYKRMYQIIHNKLEIDHEFVEKMWASLMHNEIKLFLICHIQSPYINILKY